MFWREGMASLEKNLKSECSQHMSQGSLLGFNGET